jgi:hypothetical protein
MVPPIPGFFPHFAPVFPPPFAIANGPAGDKLGSSLYASAAAGPSIYPPLLSASPLIYSSAITAPSVFDRSKAEKNGAANGPTPQLNAPVFGTNIYASTPGVISNASLYSSAVGSQAVNTGVLNPIYASMPSLPSAPIDKSKAPKAVVSEGNSTVGLMIWPQGKELVITGLKEGTSAFTSGLEVGDIIASVDDESVDNLKAEDVALKMAGPTGSKTKITTKDGRDAILTRDVSADEANKTSVDVTNPPPQAEKVFLTPAECQKYGLPIGSSWRSKPADSQVEVTSLPKARASAPKPSFPAPVLPSSKSAPPALRYLTPQECKQFNVPIGSRFIPKSEPAVEQSKSNGELEPVVRQEVEVRPDLAHHPRLEPLSHVTDLNRGRTRLTVCLAQM